MKSTRKIILIAGYSAAGKTTFAERLSQDLSIPYFSKDMVKIALNRSFPVNNRADSKQLSAIAFDTMAFNAERFMETRQPLVLEANFVMKKNHNGIKEGDALRELIARYNYQPLTYLFLGDLAVLYERFMTRDVLPERGIANKMWGEFTFEDYKKFCQHFGEFDIGGEIVKIDATNLGGVDFCKYIEIANKFLKR
ncbi:MAG: ATP-binding protein [Defluviitaleaceae bacterium]|nr:ATP-binding protein [Defluviitaleaceae bacterium]